MFPFYVFVICRANLVEKQKTHPRPGLWVGLMFGSRSSNDSIGACIRSPLWVSSNSSETRWSE